MRNILPPGGEERSEKRIRARPLECLNGEETFNVRKGLNAQLGSEFPRTTSGKLLGELEVGYIDGTWKRRCAKAR